MSSPVTAADYVGTPPVTAILCPDDGDTVVADDIRVAVAALLAECDDIRNNATTGLANKVDRDGDDMTDTLGITTSTANQPALNVAGNGTGEGITAIGGATGRGGTFQAGGGNAIGAYATGSGSGAGVSGLGGVTGVGGQFIAGGGDAPGVTATGNGIGTGVFTTGGTNGPGISAMPGTTQSATVPQLAGSFSGYIKLAGTDPNASVDPGSDNAIHGANTTKARGRIFLGGSPPYLFLDNYNFSATTTTPGAGTTRVTMVRAMADKNYSVFLNVHGAVGYAVSETNIAGRTTTAFEFTVFSTTTGTPGVATAEYVDILVEGRQ